MPESEITTVAFEDARRLDVTKPVGARISMLIDRENGATHLTECVTRLDPGVTLRPVHSHVDIEEIVFVLEGEGETWVDGKTCRFRKGDSVLYPPNSRHTLTNVGQETLVLLCFFSDPDYRRQGAYKTHEERT